LKGAGSTDDDEAFGLASDASGNVYITGYIGVNSTVSFGTHSITNTTNSLNPFIAKYNSAGADQWARVCQVDNFSYSQGNEIKLDAAGNPYIIGYYSSDSIKIGAVTLYNNSIATYGGGDTLRDIFVAKYKSNGNLSWARTAGGKSNDYGNGIATGSNNSVYITGEFLSDSISFAGILLARTNLSIAGDGDAFIANNISTNPIVPNICMVTVDTVLAQNNIIVWDKTPYVNLADSFIVYREISTNNYQPIGAVPYSAMSTFTDTVRHKYSNTGDPNAGTYRYKISLRDTSGNYSMLSPYHNTIYITNSNGTFSWPQLYTIENGANPVTNYALMRDDNSTGNWHMINSIAGTQQSVTDPNYSGFTANGAWRVQTIWNINCIPSIINNDPQIMTISLNSSRSNVYRVNGNGIQEFGNTLQVDLFPNPSTGIFSMEVGNNLNQYKIEICNVLGEKVYSATTNNHSTIIHLDSPSGVYFLTIKSENGTAVKKIIKE
jgi:hypothetical protein